MYSRHHVSVRKLRFKAAEWYPSALGLLGYGGGQLRALPCSEPLASASGQLNDEVFSSFISGFVLCTCTAHRAKWGGPGAAVPSALPLSLERDGPLIPELMLT